MFPTSAWVGPRSRSRRLERLLKHRLGLLVLLLRSQVLRQVMQHCGILDVFLCVQLVENQERATVVLFALAVTALVRNQRTQAVQAGGDRTAVRTT